MSAVAPAEAILRLHPGDPVGVARRELRAGEALVGGERRVVVRGTVPHGHKVALTDVAEGEVVRKYGQVIGIATRPIAAGEHVHEHNLVSPSRAGAGSGAEAAGTGGGAPPGERTAAGATPAEAPGKEAATGGAAPGERTAAGAAAGGAAGAASGAAPTTFSGIVRSDGRAGTRNYVLVMSSVNCSATVVKRIAAAFALPGALDAFPGVDGVLAVTHPGGCGTAAGGPGLELLRRTLTGYARHPNVGGVLVVGLGCEVNQVAALTAGFALPAGIPVEHMTIQEQGGAPATVRAGVERVRELLASAAGAQRRPVPLSALMLGLNCGGSDAWSGVSANPVLGAAVDRLVALGGTAVLAETPEIHGAEHLLTGRAATPEVAEQLRERVRWWEEYVAADGGSLDNNPSPGNRAGGVTTIEEKSLGAVAKGGSSPLRAVYGYAEPITSPGLVFMDTPGYDPVSVTGIVAGGANVVCFTTGRGSVFGSKPAPSLKLASTSELYRRMIDDMDVDCGPVLTGEATVAGLGEELLAEIVAVASGRRTKSEEFGFGDEEFNPWQLGAVM